MRPLAVALVVLLSASSARAVPIVGYAEGFVAVPRSFQNLPFGAVPYFFTVGESVSVRYTYDDEWPAIGTAGVGFRIATGGGYTFAGAGGNGSDVQKGTGDNILLGATRDPWNVTLSFQGGVGRLDFYTDRAGRSEEGFIAAVTRTAGPSPVPEPSTLALGMLGAALAGGGWMRRHPAPAGGPTARRPAMGHGPPRRG